MLIQPIQDMIISYLYTECDRDECKNSMWVRDAFSEKYRVVNSNGDKVVVHKFYCDECVNPCSQCGNQASEWFGLSDHWGENCGQCGDFFCNECLYDEVGDMSVCQGCYYMDFT